MALHHCPGGDDGGCESLCLLQQRSFRLKSSDAIDRLQIWSETSILMDIGR